MEKDIVSNNSSTVDNTNNKSSPVTTLDNRDVKAMNDKELAANINILHQEGWNRISDFRSLRKMSLSNILTYDQSPPKSVTINATPRVHIIPNRKQLLRVNVYVITTDSFATEKDLYAFVSPKHSCADNAELYKIMHHPAVRYYRYLVETCSDCALSVINTTVTIRGHTYVCISL